MFAPTPATAHRYGDPAVAAAFDLAASAHVYETYGRAGGTEEVMAMFDESIDGDLGSAPEEMRRSWTFPWAR
ncbi:MAG: hypothetical protein ACLP50_11780 [Solirubrobacteraceae bacterium]